MLFRILALLLAGALVAKMARERRVPRGLAVTLAIALAFWVLAGLDREGQRLPISNRYQYPSTVFILLVAAEALVGVRLSRPATVAVVAASALAALAGLKLLDREREVWIGLADQTRAALAGVEAAGTTAPSELLHRRTEHPGYGR